MSYVALRETNPWKERRQAINDWNYYCLCCKQAVLQMYPLRYWLKSPKLLLVGYKRYLIWLLGPSLYDGWPPLPGIYAHCCVGLEYSHNTNKNSKAV